MALVPEGMPLSADGLTLYVSARLDNAILVFDRDPATGAISQKPGADGCIADDKPDCRDARALGRADSLALSPDGRHLYAAGEENTVDGRALELPWDIAVTPDGRHVLVGTLRDRSVVAFNRNATTGGLSPVGGAGGCVDYDGSDGCRRVTSIGYVGGLAISPAGDRVYVSSANATGRSGILAVLNRAASGALRRHTGATGCVTDSAVTGCGRGRNIGFGRVALSPRGDHLYVAGGRALTGGVTSHRVLADGGIAQRPGPNVTVAARSRTRLTLRPEMWTAIGSRRRSSVRPASADWARSISVPRRSGPSRRSAGAARGRRSRSARSPPPPRAGWDRSR